MDSILSVQKQRTFQETGKSLRKFIGPSQKPKVLYTDNSLELGKSCEDLSWNHRTSTPHRSETNGIAERTVVLQQSGLDEKRWADSTECSCYLRNVQNLLADGKAPDERRFGDPFKGPVILFGAMVEYHPISPRDQSGLHQLDKKVLSGIFLGYELIAGGIWRRDILIADLEALEKFDASGNLSSKNQRERSIDITKRRWIHCPSSTW